MKEESEELVQIQKDIFKDLNSKLEVCRYTLSNVAANVDLKILAAKEMIELINYSLEKIAQLQQETDAEKAISPNDLVRILPQYLSQYSSSEEQVWKVDGVSKGECGTITCLISLGEKQILVPIETLNKVS